jgi:NTP pyrophosphatase (non-canonical NTP hydrolase)
MKEIEIINHYGYRHQIRKLAEEQYELIEALFENDQDHITEEIADCLVLINQFKAYYEIKDKDIQKVYDYKIARQEKRIANENLEGDDKNGNK